MGKLTLNKHYSTAAQCISNFDPIYGTSEIVICNNIDEPGIYIYATGASSQKINVMDMSVIKLKNNPSATETGTVVSGDTLEKIVAKLQNRIDAASGITSGATTKISNIVVGVGLNPDGTYKAIAGKYVGTATTVAEAITALSNAIEAEKADAIAQGKTYTDTKVKEEIEKLDADIKAPYGTVFTAITEVDGKISADTQMLHVEVDAAVTTSNHYNFYLSSATASYKWGEIDVPKDQFLKDVSFIASATTGDVAIAAGRGCLIYEGHAYLVFNFTTSSGDKWVYTDMTTLVGGLTAKDIKISSAYTKTSYNIKANTPLEDAVDYITTELDNLNTKTSANTITSTGKTITVTTSATNTNVDVYIDNESIVTNEKAQAGQEGRLSTYINIKRDMESASTATASTRMTYHLVKSGGTYYGGGSETAMTQDIVIPRHFITPDEVTGPGKWVKVGTSAETAVGRYVVDTTKIGLAVQENIKNALGETEAMGNGLTTAWAVREFMKEGIDGDDVMVGWADHLPGSLLSYYGNIADGHILGTVAKANNVHEAIWKVNNNFDRIADSIGLLKPAFDESYYIDTVYKYDSANTQSYKYIKTATTVMGAIKALDTTIENMDFLKDTSSSAHYMTGITQVDGKITEIREAKLPDASFTKDDQGVKVSIAQKDGKLSGLTVEVTTLDTDATITSTANDVVSGKGVRSVIDALDVTKSGTSAGVAVTVAEANGLISAVTVSATTLDTDTAITSAATSVVSGKGVRAAIDALDSTATTTSNAYALTSVTITNGKISGKGETNKIASASTAASADTLDGKHATDLLTEFTNTSTGTNGESRITVGGTSKTCKVNADTVDGYHFVVGSTGTTANTIYFL